MELEVGRRRSADRLRRVEVDRGASLKFLRPHAKPDVVVGARFVPPCRRIKAISRDEVRARCMPSEIQRYDIHVVECPILFEGFQGGSLGADRGEGQRHHEAVVGAEHFLRSHADERRKHRTHVEPLKLGSRQGVAVVILDVVGVDLRKRNGDINTRRGLSTGIDPEVAVKVVAEVLSRCRLWYDERAGACQYA